ASWGKRVGAYFIDVLPQQLLFMIAMFVVFFASVAVGMVIMLLASLGGVIWMIFNRWINAGKTGQSLGKRVMGISLVSAHTGQPIGAGAAFGRDFAHAIDGVILYIGFLMPLWDPQAQTVADKIVDSIVIDAAPTSGAGHQSGFAPPMGAPQQYSQLPPNAAQPAMPQGSFPPGQGVQPVQSGQYPQQW